jgi:DNA-binding IclR family transcriptional regulator
VTENTLTDIDQIMEHYRRVREQGTTLGNEGYRIGFVGIAAPVFDKDGRAFAAVALSCPKTLLSREALVENYLGRSCSKQPGSSPERSPFGG